MNAHEVKNHHEASEWNERGRSVYDISGVRIAARSALAMTSKLF